MEGNIDEYGGVHVAVLGATGFIGRWVARYLCNWGARVSLIVRNRATSEEVLKDYGIHGDLFEADLRGPDVLQELFQEIQPSIVFNLAGYGVDRNERDEEAAHQINAQLVQAICEAVRGTRNPEWMGQDIVHVGSALEYGTIGGDLSEDSIPCPTTVYGKSKLAGTRILAHSCESYGVKGVTARLFTVYGPGEHAGRLLPSFLEVARTADLLPMTAGNQKRDFTYVEDVAEGLLRLGVSTSKLGEIVNLATGKLSSVREFAETAASILQIPGHRLKFGMLPTREDEMQHSEVKITRLQRLIAWTPSTTIATGIRKTEEFVVTQLRGEF